jgi:hypothetical protein
MNPHEKSWQRLAAAARQHRDSRDESAPYGFAARVAAQALAGNTSSRGSLLEKFALRGLLAACALCLVSTLFGVLNGGTDDTEFLAGGDIVGELLDLS